ncbi:MAG: hypothetical protein J6W64_04770 [Bacilli bacterium]|nr:hypothetical protein [Bacilli bacterium]
MCLAKTHRLPKISRKPIQVYKLFCKKEDNILCTPVVHYKCKLGDTIKASHSWIRSLFAGEITSDGVHAFIIAGEYCFNLAYFYSADVYLCEIPPYTPYWIGENYDIAASKMIIKEKL